MPGFLKGPKLAAIVRTLRLRKLYISRFTSVMMPFDLYSQKGRQEERALVDSGATANFIDYKTVKRLGLGSKKLDQMRTVKNIDGTLNVAGNITHACNLLVSQGRKQERTRFFVTNLGGDRFIFGYPWLAAFNPDINWPEAIVKGPRFRVETLVHGKLTQQEYLHHVQTVAIAQLEEGDELIMSLEVLGQEPMHIRKTTLAQQMAEKAYDATKVNTEETVPAVFKQHWRVFSEQEARQLPPHREYDHRIELRPDAPHVINSKVYPLSQNEQKVLDEYLTDNLEKGYIVASSSRYGSPTFTVKKKDGTLRIVHDYRRLNEFMVMDVTPLPCISSILEELRGKALFSKFDIRARYNNIRIRTEDTYKTGFKTNKGLYEWIIMPFGLCTAPATFTRMLNEILRPLYAKYPGMFRHYMDDCIIMTEPGQRKLHEEICHMFFDLLEQHQLFLKPAKCEFFQTEMDYLGIRVKEGELMIDPAKISGITDWPTTLTTIKEVRSTLGLLGYHRPWIPTFAKIAKPRMELLQHGQAFAWIEHCEKAVRRLIGLVTSESVIVPPDTDQQFILYVDASQFATGVILYQADKERKDARGNPLLRRLGFNSQTFNKTEQNYPIYDRELLGMMRGLRTWRHLLRNTTHPVLVITDHANLQYYREPQKLGPRVNGYLAELAEYHIQLVYKPGAAQRADGLSRRPDLIPDDDDELIIVLPDHLFVSPNAPQMTYSATRTKAKDYYSDDTLVDSENEDAQLKARATMEDLPSGFALDQMVHDTQKMEERTIRRWCMAHTLSKSGDLWTKEGAFVVVGNNTLKRGVISLFHDSTMAGHPGITKTLALMKPYYWWPNMKNFVTEYVKGCVTCQMTKVNTQPTRPPLFPIYSEVNALPFQTISLDFIVKLLVSDGYNTILTITNHDCSKAAIFIPCNEEIDAAGVAKVYATYVFPHYGLPKKVISNQDPRFASNFSRELCDLLKIKQNISSAYHPQTDGQSERTNQSLEQYLRLYCGSQQKEWAFWLPLAQYTRNSWPNASTKKSPFELILGYVPLAHQPSREANIPDINNRLARIKEAREEAQHALKQTQEKMIKETRFKGFEIGNKVWLEGTNIKRPYESKKLSPKRYGPFEVVAKISHVAYQIKLPETWGIHDMFHASLLTPYKETDEHGTNFLEPPPEMIEGEEEWEIEQILGKRHFGRGKKLQYLVRWKDYSPAHDQWVDKSDITADELVEIFERENREERPPRRSIRTPRKRTNEIIRSIHLSPTSQHYHRSMSSNANTIDAQQVLTNSGNAPAKVPSPHATLPTDDPSEATIAVVDATVFAGATHTPPVQIRDGTAPLSLVPIGGAFTKDATTPQTEPISPSVTNKDGEDHAPSPLTLSPIPTQSERSTSPTPLPTPPRPQLSRKPRTNSTHSGLLADPNTHREHNGSEDMSTLWRRVQALK